MAGLINAYELEDEIGRTSKVQKNNKNHSEMVLPTRPEACHDKNHNRHRDGGNCEIEFDLKRLSDDNKELHGKAQEEKEVEFEEGNIDLRISISMVNLTPNCRAYLESQKSLLHP